MPDRSYGMHPGEVAALQGLHVLGERRHQRFAIEGLPPFPAVARIVGPEHQTLNRVVLVALEGASRWDVLDCEDPRLMDLKLTRLASLG